MATTPQDPRLNFPAPEFSLRATDGRSYTLDDVMGEKGAVIVFICNHCPYVKAVTERLVETANTLKTNGIGFAAICSNDASTHPEDSFDNMKAFAHKHGFSFPYLHDESQEIARAYEAVCTPDFYGMNADRTIKYRGRLDAGRTSLPPPDARPELLDAMLLIAETGEGPEDQTPSMGCGIKWKAA